MEIASSCFNVMVSHIILHTTVIEWVHSTFLHISRKSIYDFKDMGKQCDMHVAQFLFRLYDTTLKFIR